MSLLDRWRGGKTAELNEVRTLLNQEAASAELLQESIVELELALDDVGWQREMLMGVTEFSKAGLNKIIQLARLSRIKNPLIRRAVNVWAFYVWGQGVQIKGRDPQINEVVQTFLDDHGNREEIFGHSARSENERTLHTDGNLFFTLFTNPKSGHVRVRSIPVDEITDVIRNPDDRLEPWFYVRQWNQVMVDGSVKGRKAYYPDWRFRPAQRATSVNHVGVEWDSPVYHVKVGGLKGAKFGIPEVYASLDWAKAHTKFLEDQATIWRSLSKFAWKASGSKRARASVKQRLGSTLGQGGQAETNPPPTVGAVALTPTGGDFTPISKSGATINPEDAKQLRLMVGAGNGLPDTILSGDPDQGNLATAKTLDRPTELAMRDRQMLWADVHRDLIGYQLLQVAKSKMARRRLPGARVVLDPVLDDELVVFPEAVDATVDVVFPPILEQDMPEVVKSIVEAASVPGMPADKVVQLILVALGVEDVDELMEQVEEDLAVVQQARADPTGDKLAAAVESLSEAMKAA